MQQTYDGVNADDKDFDQAYPHTKPYVGKPPVRADYRSSSMTLIKGYVGSGIMALPYSFNEGGWLLSNVLFCISVVFLLKSINLLADVALAENKENQGLTEFANVTYGEKGKNITKILLISYQIGKAIAYLIFFIQFFQYVFPSIHSLYHLGLALLIVVPFGFIDNMALFAKISFGANILTMIGLLYIVLYDGYQILKTDALKQNIPNLANFEKFPMVLGVSVYGFGCLPIAFAVRPTMEDPKTFKKLFFQVSMWVVVLYLVFTNLCVWAMGSGISQIVLFSIKGNPLTYTVQVIYALGLIFSYPLQILPAFQQIERMEILKTYINPEIKYSRFRRLLLRAVMNVGMGFIGFGIPSFAYFTNILGSVGGTSLNILFPAIIYLKYFNNQTKKQLFIVYGTIVFGIIGGFCAFIYSIIKLVNR